jgi:hypothetical protein
MLYTPFDTSATLKLRRSLGEALRRSLLWCKAILGDLTMPTPLNKLDGDNQREDI